MDEEQNRISQRVRRYASVGSSVGGLATRIAANRLFGIEGNRGAQAAELAAALGGLKGPIMKVAQLLSTIPEALPAEYAAELSQLQSQAPPMGASFVKRRMAAELGPNWQQKFANFTNTAAASASLGQVHKATAHDGRALAVKLQYPDMQSAVEADLTQLKIIFAIHKRMDPAIDTGQMIQEIAARLREELDYTLEAAHMKLYRAIFAGDALIRVPDVLPELSTKRLLTMTWLEGRRLLDFKQSPEGDRNMIARAMFRAWWYPFSRYGVIHGDPHLGNYNVWEEPRAPSADSCFAPSDALGGRLPGGESPSAGQNAPSGRLPERESLGAKQKGVNLLDYGCMRTFAPKFIGGVIDLYKGLIAGDRARIVHAYETWGFTGLSAELIDLLNIWAKFIYGPLLDDRVRTIAEGTTPGEYGRREAFAVHKGLKEKGPVLVPREFVFMDRAAIGLGGVFLHLDARQNWHDMFNELIEDFSLEKVAGRQRAAFAAAGVPLPEGMVARPA